MSNEVASFLGGSGAIANATDFANALGGMTKEVAPAGVGGGFLKFDDLENIWKHGVAGTALTVESSLFAANLATFRTGYSHWKDGEKVEAMASLGETPIRLDDLPQDLGNHPKNALYNAGDPIKWDAQMSLEFVGVSGLDEGVKFRIDATGKGLRTAISSMIEEVRKRVAIDQEFYTPVVEFGADEYQNKQRNKKSYWPWMKVTSWANANGQIADEEAVAIASATQETATADKPVQKRARRTVK